MLRMGLPAATVREILSIKFERRLRRRWFDWRPDISARNSRLFNKRYARRVSERQVDLQVALVLPAQSQEVAYPSGARIVS